MVQRIAGLVLLTVLAGCGSGDGVGGVSASEASALNDAAAMLDARAGAAQRDAGDDLNPAARAASRADRGRTVPVNEGEAAQ
ncbi:hypothetical protein [Sphingobium ummariense]